MGQGHKPGVMQRQNEKTSCDANTFRNIAIFESSAVVKLTPPLRKHHNQPRCNRQMWLISIGSERFERLNPLITAPALIKFFLFLFCSKPYLTFDVWV